MSAVPATLMLALWSAPALAQEAPSELDARSAELDARAAELEARAAELEALFDKLEQQRDAVEEMRLETQSMRAELRTPEPAAPPEPPVAVEAAEPPAPPQAPAPPEVAANRVRGEVLQGERVTIGSDAVVEAHEQVEEVVAVGGDVDVYGRVLGDATSFGGVVHVHEGGSVDGNAIAIGGQVKVEDGAHVGGRVPISATGNLSISLDDDDDEVRVERHHEHRSSFGEALYAIYSHLLFMLSFAGVGVLTVGLFPNRVARIARAIQDRPIRVAVLGGFVNLMLFAATFFMAITIIGLPVAALLGLFLALAWLFGFVGLCQAIGDRLPFEHKPHGRWLAFLIGVVVVTFVSALGTLGFMTVMAASIVGMGAAFHTRLGGA